MKITSNTNPLVTKMVKTKTITVMERGKPVDKNINLPWTQWYPKIDTQVADTRTSLGAIVVFVGLLMVITAVVG